MAIIERSITSTEEFSVATPSTSLGALKRPVSTTGWKSWLFTVDHKKLGIMYSAAALFFFIVGRSEFRSYAVQWFGDSLDGSLARWRRIVTAAFVLRAHPVGAR